MKSILFLVYNLSTIIKNCMEELKHELLVELLAAANVGWWKAEVEKKRYVCSKLIVDLLGLPQPEISFEDFNRYIADETRPPTEFQPFEKLYPQREGVYLLRTPHGHVWTRSKICMEKTDENGAVLLYGLVEIIESPESVSARQALKESERILHNIYKNLPVGIELYDKNGILIDLNDKEMELFHLKSKDALMGINLFENPIFPPHMREKIRKHEDADFAFRYDFAKIGAYYQTEKREGSIDLVTKVTTLYDEHHNPINFLLIHADHTEEIVANNRVQEFENLFELVGDYAKVGYAYYNLYTRNGYASKSWYHNVGENESLPVQDIAGIYQHIHPEDREKIIGFLRNAQRGLKHKFNREVRILRGDGSCTWTHVNLFVRKYAPEEGMIEIVSINYDITTLKCTEEKLTKALDKVEEVDRMKSAFIDSMSHEIRTPLNAIVGFSSLLPSVENKADQEEFIKLIKHNTDLLLKLVNDVLDVARMESGGFDLKVAWFDPAELMQECVEDEKQNIPPQVVLTAAGFPQGCMVEADRTRIKQVVSNLLSNALKNTRKGEVKITGRVDEEGIEIRVSDTGQGIPADMLERIFKRFEKVDSFQQGVGLGLPISRAILQKMGGKIKVESTVGIGSTFIIQIPCKTHS